MPPASQYRVMTFKLSQQYQKSFTIRMKKSRLFQAQFDPLGLSQPPHRSLAVHRKEGSSLKPNTKSRSSKKKKQSSMISTSPPPKKLSLNKRVTILQRQMSSLKKAFDDHIKSQETTAKRLNIEMKNILTDTKPEANASIEQHRSFFQSLNARLDRHFQSFNDKLEQYERSLNEKLEQHEWSINENLQSISIKLEKSQQIAEKDKIRKSEVARKEIFEENQNSESAMAINIERATGKIKRPSQHWRRFQNQSQENFNNSFQQLEEIFTPKKDQKQQAKTTFPAALQRLNDRRKSWEQKERDKEVVEINYSNAFKKIID